MLSADERPATPDLSAGARPPEASGPAARLLENPRTFHFFQAVELLCRLAPDRAEPGRCLSYTREVVRFRNWATLVRSPTDIRSLAASDDPDESAAYVMEIAFTGLYGLSAPTPAYFWEYLAQNPESPLRDFLDIFTTRMVGHFFRAWKRHRWHLEFRGGLSDPTTRRVFCLMGLGTERRASRGDLENDSFESPTTILAEHPALDPIGDRARLLAYSGLFAQRTRPAVNLRRLLWDFFDGPADEREPFVGIEENVLRWAFLQDRDQTRLGQANSRMAAGGHVVAGVRVRDRMGLFRIHLGPLDLERFRSFLPIGQAYPKLLVLVREASPFATEFEVELRLRPRDVPRLTLGRTARLGWSSWIGDAPRVDEGRVRLRSSVSAA